MSAPENHEPGGESAADEITFADLDLSPEILRGVEEAGFRVPSPIQGAAIPPVLEGRDIIAQAHTGTGKTAAFGLPLMSRVTRGAGTQILVLCPTRELAGQVSDEMYRLGKYADCRSATVCGGASYRRQFQLLERGPGVVVATPGRLLDLLRGGRIKLAPRFFVLDEADEMLDMGFLDDIREIIDLLPEPEQTLLFSATMPPAIKELSKTLLKNPIHIDLVKGEKRTAAEIDQLFCVMAEHERDEALLRVIESQNPDRTLVFCRTREETERVGTLLSTRGHQAGALHGDMDQRSRDRRLKELRDGTIEILVATDVAARGLDVRDVSHVINFHIPWGNDTYVHRIGRTGRAGASGIAITLVTPAELHKLERIGHGVGATMEPLALPSRRQMQTAMARETLLESLDINVDPAMGALVKEVLKEEPNLTAKLLMMLLNQRAPKGPETIGLDLRQVQALLAQRRRPQGRGKGKGKYKGGYKGNRRGGYGGPQRKGGKHPYGRGDRFGK